MFTGSLHVCNWFRHRTSPKPAGMGTPVSSEQSLCAFRLRLRTLHGVGRYSYGHWLRYGLHLAPDLAGALASAPVARHERLRTHQRESDSFRSLPTLSSPSFCAAHVNQIRPIDPRFSPLGVSGSHEPRGSGVARETISDQARACQEAKFCLSETDARC